MLELMDGDHGKGREFLPKDNLERHSGDQDLGGMAKGQPETEEAPSTILSWQQLLDPQAT